MTRLILERRRQQNKTAQAGPFSITPPIHEAYWAYRVRLSDRQAIVGFPKFSTIGIGFALEEDWNTNLPYTCDTDEIFHHILDNKGDDSIADEDVHTAIAMVQNAIHEDQQAVTA
ncbi:hypothetical protein IU443_28570 [Nocardia farcinica]|uniref:hypothetical protein n=1 Tax=Nocardia farcinica TaxID=37329 RepID=UPI001892EA3C|nr:hypothetical protein [Nocardia farcinica]MBF6393887.1 hypothetical protein [Nocardia farcinica]